MNNPRDFLPAKYKKNDTKETLGMSDSVSDQTTNSDSPWSNLAKEPKIPSYRSNTIESDQLDPKPNVLDTQIIDTATDNSANEIIPPASFPKVKSKANNKKLAGLLVLFFLVIGVFSSYLLTQESQDNRQQASEGQPKPGDPHIPDANGNCPSGLTAVEVVGTGKKVCVTSSAQGGGGEPPTSCGAGMTLVVNSNTGNNMCALTSQVEAGTVYNIPVPTPGPLCNNSNGNCQGHFGWCWNTNSPCNADQWNDPGQHIAGTYTWRYGCTGSSSECSCSAGETDCKRYVINIPSTLNAAVNYMTNNPGMANLIRENETLLQANQQPLEVAPFKTCVHMSGVNDGYNTISCNSTDCAYTQTYEIAVPGGTPITQSRCYLTPEAYQAEINAGRTWAPYNTGCGDGVYDQMSIVTTDSNGVTGPTNGINPEYAGDCNTWHFTTCLNQGTGVNGLGCDIITTTTNPPDEPPDEPPTEPPTQPPTEPPTGTPTLPPELLCTDLEMLSSLGELMEGDDDQDLINGDQVRFRGNSSDNSNPEVTFEFRILPPNTYAWQDLTNTDTSATAKNISAPYTIISSGHHIVQSRVCLAGVCQAWESNDEIDEEFTSIFEDVPVTYWAYRSILAIYNEEITAGCSSDPLRFCPEEEPQRDQAAALIMKAKYGADYDFTAATTPVFADVEADNVFRAFIEKMYADGITAGCSSDPLNFCPDDEITRAEMAVMLERTFLR